MLSDCKATDLNQAQSFCVTCQHWQFKRRRCELFKAGVQKVLKLREIVANVFKSQKLIKE
jgi:hypothetical protein